MLLLTAERCVQFLLISSSPFPWSSRSRRPQQELAHNLPLLTSTHTKISVGIGYNQTKTPFRRISRRDKLCAYVNFSEKQTQKHQRQPTVRGKGPVMAVLVSLLAPGCQTQITTVTRRTPSSEPRLDSSTLKASLWGKLRARVLSEDWIKMSCGADWARWRPLSHRRSLGANNGWQWREGVPEIKEAELSLAVPVSLGKWPRECNPSFIHKVRCIMQIFMHSRDLFYLADCHNSHTLTFQSKHSSKHFVPTC